MKKHLSVFLIVSFLLFFIFATVSQIITNLGLKLGLNSLINTRTASGTAWQTAITELVMLFLWWLLNRTYLKAKTGWQTVSGKGWLLLLPVVILLAGDSTLGAHFVLTPAHIIAAIAVGFSAAAFEEYVFRGILVRYLYHHFGFSALTTAGISGLSFGLIHAFNGLSSGNWLNTGAQVLMAIGVGFFLAAVYLVTNNLLIPILFHGIIDAFDQLAFSTLSNTAGTSIITGTIYFVVFIILGWLVVTRGTIRTEQGQRLTPTHEKLDYAQHADVPVTVSPIKSIAAIALILLELLFGTLLIHSGQSKTLKVSIVVGLGFIVFVALIWLYRDVLKANWKNYRVHLWRNLGIDFLLTIGIYVILAFVRTGMRSLTGNASAIVSVNDMLSFQSIASAGLGVFSSVTVLMAPFSEEIAFRHVLFYQWKNNKLLMWAMFVISSVGFGLIHWNNFHGDLTQMIPYMFIGAFFALIYYFSRNIWQNIITHFMFDFLQFAAALFLLVITLLQH